MSSKTLTTFKFFAAVALAVAVIFGATFAVSTVKAQALTLSELVELFISLGIIPADKADAARAALSTSGGSTPTPSTGSCSITFTRNLRMGASGAEVMEVQKFLNGNGFTVAASGAGSAGNETSYFGSATHAAVIKFQNAYAADILTPVGLTAGNGNWYAGTRAKANAICAGSTPTTPGTTTGTLQVMSTTQPANSLAPASASRVPFTKFTLTNSSNAAVTVNGVTVERTGLSVNTNVSGVVLVDENNIQYGIAKTLNSNNQAVIGDTFTLNPGQSKTFTVAANIAANPQAGQVMSFNVVGISTSATVSGSLPITGASHVTNTTLSVGSVSTSTSAYDPGVAQSKVIGDTAVRFSGLRFTASSVEDVRLYSIRWRQAGTASASDLSNVMTYVDGTAYPTTVSADGKYYTTTFPGGVLIEKGFSKDVYIQGDITGSGAAGRTVAFDIDRSSDVYFVGQLYGYGIAVSGTYSPWYDAYVTSVTAGTATAVSKANEVPAQNIAVNVPNQVLGGFATEFKGEAVSVQTLTVTYSTTTASVGLITGATIVNANGQVVAGPVDATWVGSTATFAFSDTITFPVGRQVYTIKGKIPASAGNNATVALATTPSSNWTNATGQISGNTISLPSNTVTMNTMTVKAGALSVSVSATPASQNVVAGQTGFTVANYQFDATQSGEDVRFSNFKIDYDETSLSTGDPVNCFAWDGATRLNSSSVSPSANGTEYTFTFDTPLVVSKGTVKTVAVKCDLPASLTTGSFAFGVAAQPGTSSNSFSGTGVSSGTTIYPLASANAGSTMTIAGTGTLAVSADSSSPSYSVAAAGTSGVTLGVLRFDATNEDINLQRIALQMSNTSASSSPSDLQQVTLWDGATQVGTALFTGTNRNATSTLTSTVTVPVGSHKLITIKGNLSMIGTAQPGTQGALIQIDYDGNDTTGTQGIGAASGTAINPSSSDTSFAGVRVFKSYPTFAAQNTGLSTSLSGGNNVLYRFAVSANAAGGIGLREVTVNLATSSASVTNLQVTGYTDSSFSQTVSGFTNGTLSTVANPISGNNAAAFTGTLQIPAGSTYYFEVTGDVSLGSGTNQVTTRIVGDSAYPSLATLMGVHNTSLGNFVWSPNATTTSSTTHVDWTNGYSIPGLPAAGSTSFAKTIAL